MKKIILLLVAFILTACSFDAHSEVDTNRQTWQNSGITHYRFTLFIGCFCPFRDQMPITIEVQNGEVISMTASDGTLIPETDPGYENFTRYATMDRIFTTLEAGLSGDADEVTVTYDPIHGFPSEIYFDYIKDAVDDELSLTISDFEALK